MGNSWDNYLGFNASNGSFSLIFSSCHTIPQKTLSLWIFGLLLIDPTGVLGLHHFPENYVMAKRGNSVTLTCNTNFDGPFTWKFAANTVDEAEEIEDFNTIYKQVGKNLIVSDVDSPALGEYSCWSGEERLSSTFLLVEAEEGNNFDSLMKCWAKSYDCTFSCNWAKGLYTAVRLGLGDDCSEGRKSCHWVNSSGQHLNGGFQFELSHSLSPYAEETNMLVLTAEAIINHNILRRTKRFYLRDIIQPESPQIVNCQEMEQELNVTIDPPSTWSSPHSFFSLEHEIQYKLKDDGKEIKVIGSPSVLIPKKISMLRVRSRDPLVLSNWSQWTPWKNVIIKEKKWCCCRNTAKSCCPELPPGYLDNCKRKCNKGGNKKRNKNAKRNQTPYEEYVQ
ncbi:interleukin-12 subunit beta isoform X3 [Seriola aureovittata]|uniref:interleukin-12 subunit beta isoform X3 n=1 Tax=Seriola aureovittata TaxID=2871759 RepID=UPI0024BDD768|nr:interleukin-12 subunit beta isoform X3 [Seriola aureovittata]